MAINNEFQWRFGIGPSNSHIYDYAYSAPAVVSAENCEVWRVYLEKLIKRTFSEETMNTAEFQEAMEQVRKRKISLKCIITENPAYCYSGSKLDSFVSGRWLCSLSAMIIVVECRTFT
jgi:hypothetical protein